MVSPIRPDFSSPESKHLRDLLSEACAEVIESQHSNLKSLASQNTPQRSMESQIAQHEQELFRTLDNNASTKGLTEKVKQEFVAQEVSNQKEEFLSPLKTAPKSGTKAPFFEQQRPGKISVGAKDNPPANESTLDIDGVSVYVWTAPNGQKLYLPVGHSSQGSDDNTPSEAWGYSMRCAVAANDPTFFQQLAQSYLYFCNQSASFTNMFGLMGWNPDMKTCSYSDTSAATSASDADEDIIDALIGGYQKFGNLTITDPVSSGPHKSMSLKDLTLAACETFIKGNGQSNGDIGSFTVNGKTYNPVLTLDSWGHDASFPDYFDPCSFADMINFLSTNNTNGQYTQDIGTLKSAANNTMQYISDIANGSNGWIPNTPYSYPANANSFGYDAVRVLMRLGQFIATPGAQSLFGDTFYNQAVTTLKNLVGNIMPLVNSDGQFPPSGLTGGCFTGPLMTALAALNKIGELPSNVPPSTIQTVYGYFQNDMKNYDVNDGTSGWQHNGYYNIELGVLNASIMRELGIYPGATA